MPFLKNIYKCMLQNIARRAAHTEAGSRTCNEFLGSNLGASLQERLKTHLIPMQNGAAAAVSIYKVPTDLRNVEPKAYEPNIISIGPYHHGSPHLQGMQDLKWSFFHRLFSPSAQHGAGAKLERLITQLKQLEQEARSCYEDHVSLKISNDKFTEIMLLDGCFIVELLRELKKGDFRHGSVFIKRWMLPVLKRDLIMLENQLPLFVLLKVYDLTSSTSESKNPCLKELALQFFNPLLSRDLNTGQNTLVTPGGNRPHLLDLFRASLLPTETSRGREPHMYRSMAELRESGVRLKMAKDQKPLEVSFKKGVLKIPPIHFDDHKFTLFRNMVAFEQCHLDSKPDITMYIFFLDGLINSAKDLEIFHNAGVIRHSLGGNKGVARIVNLLCKEVIGDIEESYLHNVVWKINCYCNDGLVVKRARLKHDYFYNPWASISTIAVIFLFYLTLVQTYYGLESARKDLIETGFWTSLMDTFHVPFTGVPLANRTSKNQSMQISKNYEDGSEDVKYILGVKSSKEANILTVKISPNQFEDIQSIFFSINC